MKRALTSLLGALALAGGALGAGTPASAQAAGVYANGDGFGASPTPVQYNPAYGAPEDYAYGTYGYGDPYSDGYDPGCDYYSPPWGVPPDYCRYQVWYEPIYVGGAWYSGPFYYQFYNGLNWFWLNGGWYRDEWYGLRPRIAWTGINRFWDWRGQIIRGRGGVAPYVGRFGGYARPGAGYAYRGGPAFDNRFGGRNFGGGATVPGNRFGGQNYGGRNFGGRTFGEGIGGPRFDNSGPRFDNRPAQGRAGGPGLAPGGGGRFDAGARGFGGGGPAFTPGPRGNAPAAGGGGPAFTPGPRGNGPAAGGGPAFTPGPRGNGPAAGGGGPAFTAGPRGGGPGAGPGPRGGGFNGRGNRGRDGNR